MPTAGARWAGPWPEHLRAELALEALRGVGRRRTGERLGAVVGRSAAPPAGVAVPDELARARQQSAAVARKLGQQALELDFFEQALRLMQEAGRRPSGPPDAPASTASSGRGRGGKAG